MAGSINRKVARAARTGGGRRRNEGASYGWYAIILTIVLAGTGLVAFSRHQRLDSSNPGSTAPLAPSASRSGDHWYEAYGVFLCDKFVPNITPQTDPYGITTNNDGVISISPTKKEYAGHNANLGRFAKAIGMKLTRDTVQVPGDEKSYGPNAKCGDKNAQLVVKEWTNATDDKTGKVTDVNPANLLLKDNAAVTIAFVPTDFDKNTIARPPSADQIAAVKAKAETPATTVPPADTTATTAPGAPEAAPTTPTTAGK